jgi:c-di-GMP-binding flagellar brake protein YcgR
MNTTNERVERRKHKRFQVDNSAFVILGSHYEKLGRIIDISMGGLAFRYMTAVERPNASYLAIVLPETNFCLDEVSAKTISDFELPDKLPASSITVRRCGVQFVNLTDNQKSQIEFFINNYTIGE